MKSEDPETATPSTTGRISCKRRLLEKYVVTVVSMYLSTNFVQYTFGDFTLRKVDSHWILSFVTISSMNWLSDFLYERYRGA